MGFNRIIGMVLLIFTVTLLYISAIVTEHCWSGDNNIHQHLATKTPYRYVANKDDSVVKYHGCEAIRTWIVVRHGTRNPGRKAISKMKERLPVLRDAILNAHELKLGKLCESEVLALRSWKPHVQEVDEKRLTHEGEEEMLLLAERFQNRFPSLLPEMYDNSTYRFKYTATQRAEESARYFTVGLFGRKDSRYVWFPESLHRDPILRFYKLCSRWRQEVDKNPESLTERVLFEKGPEMFETLKHISKRLGLESVEVGDAHLMYVTCSFETAWNARQRSPWCSVFSRKDLQVLEYAEDLKYYWIDGYGYEITYKQACPAVKDMLQHLMHEAESTSVVYFTHSGTLLKLLSHLGLYNDSQPLRHDNFHELRKSRLWRVSRIDSFGTNLAFVLFRCDQQLKVLALHQERPVQLPGCPSESSLCPLSALLKQYGGALSSCDFQRICTVPG